MRKSEGRVILPISDYLELREIQDGQRVGQVAIAFANYVLTNINEGKKTPMPDGNYEVTHADIMNFEDSRNE